MATKEELLEKINFLRPLEKDCNPDFSYRSHVLTTSVYRASIDKNIDLNDRAKLITQIRDMGASFSNHCKCMKK